MIYAMILAAGRSRRMGAQKLLLPLGDRTVIARIVDEALRSPVDRVFVIVGPGENDVIKALSDKRVDFVINPDVEGEMLSSVRCGLHAMPDDCTAAIVVLGDQPGIAADVIALLVETFQSSGRGIVVPIHGGRRGHPLLISMCYRDEILNCYQDVGLRGLLRAHPEDVFEVEIAAPEVIEDMDVPEDYDRAKAAYFKRISRMGPAIS
jgi:molybdenum cofactor cytidylyltransferase